MGFIHSTNLGSGFLIKTSVILKKRLLMHRLAGQVQDGEINWNAGASIKM